MCFCLATLTMNQSVSVLCPWRSGCTVGLNVSFLDRTWDGNSRDDGSKCATRKDLNERLCIDTQQKKSTRWLL